MYDLSQDIPNSLFYRGILMPRYELHTYIDAIDMISSTHLDL